MDEEERREVEWNLIGSMLLYRPAFEIGSLCLENILFHDPQARVLHKALSLVCDSGNECTLAELQERLEKIGHPELGDIDFLRGVMRRAPIGMHTEFLKEVHKLIKDHEMS